MPGNNLNVDSPLLPNQSVDVSLVLKTNNGIAKLTVPPNSNYLISQYSLADSDQM
jgi:hypothetical protein